MASVEHRIEILFKGIDQVSGVINDIGGEVEGFGKGIQDLTEPFADLTKSVLLLETAVLTVGVAAGKMAADFAASESKISAAFGISSKEAEEFGEVAKNIFTNVEFVENIEGATNNVIQAYQIMGNVGTEELEKITIKSLRISDIYEQDFSKSLDATKTLMEKFGISSDEALNFIAGGFKKGLDRSGDFLESITEYGVQFAEGDASASEFFSVLETGLQGGILGTDKAADAFKEFRIRTTENTDKVQAALVKLGIDPEQFKAKDIAAKFEIVKTEMLKLETANDQAAISVDLFGVTFEDMGLKAGLAIDTTKTKLSDLQGSIDSLDIGTFNKSFSQAWRTIISEIAKLDVWDQFLARGQEVFNQIAENFPKALGEIDFTEFIGSLDNLGSTVQEILSEMFAGADLTTAEGLQSAIQLVIDGITNLTVVSSGIIDSFDPVVKAISFLAEEFGKMDEATAESVGEWLGYITQVGLVAGAIGTTGVAITGISGILNGASAALGLTKTAVTGLYTAFTGPVGLVVAAGAVGYAIGTLINKIPNVAEGIQEAIEAIDKFFNLGLGGKTDEELDDINFAFEQAKKRAAEAAGKTDEFSKALNNAGTSAKDMTKDTENLATSISEAAETADGITLEEFRLKIKDEDVQTFKNQVEEAETLISGFIEGSVDRIPSDVVFFDIQAKVGGDLGKLRDLQDNLIEIDGITEQEQLLKIGLASEYVWERIDTLSKELDTLTKEKRQIELGIIPGTETDIKEIETKISELTKEKKEIRLELLDDEKIRKELDDLTVDKDLFIHAIADKDSAEAAKDFIITEVGDHQVITIIPEVDQSKLETVSKAVKKISPDGKEYIEYVPIVDEKAANKAKKQLSDKDFADRLLTVTANLEDSGYRADIKKFEKDADKLRVLEINAKLDIADMEKDIDLAKIEAEKLGVSLDYKAKIDIAQIEAGTKQMEKAFDSVGNSFAVVSDNITGLFGLLSGDLSQVEQFKLMRIIDEQLALQQKEYELQKKLTEAQISLMDARRQLIESGEGFKIDVNAEGLKPHLEMIWFDIAESMQSYINAQGGLALLGADV